MNTITPSSLALLATGQAISSHTKDQPQLQGGAISIEVSTPPTQAELNQMLEEANRDATMRLEMHQTQFLNLDQETRKVMDEVIKEHPSIMGKEFDFTNTGEEIEVVNHNLSDREYNYLKSKLNSNDKLVQATDFFNESLSDSYNSKLGSSRNYTKDDAAGRINVLSTLKSLDEWIKNDSNGIQRLEEKNNQPESRFQRGLSIILDTHLPIKTKA